MIKKIISLLCMKVHAQRTASEDPILQFQYRLIIPGFPDGIGFVSVSGLEDNINVTEYYESGYPTAHKLPGREVVPEVTATRGEYLGETFFKDEIKKSITNNDFRKTLIFEKLTRFGEVAKTYKLAEAWVSGWKGGDSNADSDDVSVEEITIQFEYYLD